MSGEILLLILISVILTGIGILLDQILDVLKDIKFLKTSI